MCTCVYVYVRVCVCVLSSGVIWQLDKGKKKRVWKTLQNSVIAILEQAYQEKKTDVKVKDLAVSHNHSHNHHV